MRNPDRPYPVVVDTSNSPYARLKPVPINAVTLTDDFWAPRLRINREVTIPSQYRLLEETGRMDNFRRTSGKKDVPFRGRFFNDSDVYKWLEAAAWTLATHDIPAMKNMADTAIKEIADAQQLDGYLNTHYALDKAVERWSNLRDMHELYCAGHLMQAAIAHHRSTGQEQLLDIALRFADHIIDLFGPQSDGKRPGVPGHEEIEMGLAELARETGDAKYLLQGEFFVDNRGYGLIGGSPYHQDQQPIRDMERLVGHAVRAVYLTAGATDIYAETGDPALRNALERLWSNMTTRQIYINGAIGSRYAGESFGDDYELPNARAYAETCAAIGSIMWNWRMLSLDGDARFADLIETTLYNAFLPSLSLDGESYFYQNPLADDGTHRRQTWFDCACCPPNIARLLASLPGYFFSLSDEGIWVHLYAEGDAQLYHETHGAVHLAVETRYPWDGDINLKVNGEGTFSLFLRIPAWCDEKASLQINGQPFGGNLVPGTYVQLQRSWQPGDKVRLQVPMAVRQVASHPYVLENEQRVALMRGPLLYSLEQADNPNLDLRDAVLAADTRFTAEFRPDILGGVVILGGSARTAPPDPGWEKQLYRRSDSVSVSAAGQSVEITAIPYHVWANREPGLMRVWLKQATRVKGR